MNLEVKKSVISGTFCVPGSKSHTIRAVAFATMAEGKSEIFNPLSSEDTESSLKASVVLGAEVKKEKKCWIITGHGKNLQISQDFADLGNSGTSLRIFSALAALGNKKISFDGDSSLRTRKMAPLLKALEGLGAKITSSENWTCPLSVKGPIKGGKIRMECKSSQYLTALLIATPLLENDSEIELTLLNEKPYVEITLDWLTKMGISFNASNDLMHFNIKGGQIYRPFKTSIPGDFSTATFPLASSAVTGGTVTLKNLDFSDKQGDKEVFYYLDKMGMKIRKDSSVTEVIPAKLSGIEIDMNSTPDALPAMAVIGCFADGKTILKNVPQARMKETDRIASMTCELRKMGANVEEFEDGMAISKSQLHGTELESYGDHRIAMALAIAAMGANGKSVIKNAECSSVTYPAFFDDFKNCGANFSFLS